MVQVECSAPNCLMRNFNYSKEQIKLIRSDYSHYTSSFYNFPSDLEQKNAWIEAANDSNWRPSRTAKLCMLHFRDDCFDQDGNILDHAMPTIFFSNFRKHLKELAKNANLNMTFDSNDEDDKAVRDSDDAIPDDNDQDVTIENVDISLSDYEDYEIDGCEEILISDSDDAASFISSTKKCPVKCSAKKTTKINKSAKPMVEVKEKSPSDVVSQNSIQQHINGHKEESDDGLQEDDVTNESSHVLFRVDKLVAVKVNVTGEEAPSSMEISKKLFPMLEISDSAKLAAVAPASRNLVYQLLHLAQVAHTQNASSSIETVVPNMYVITTKRYKKFNNPCTIMDTSEIISFITRIVKSIKTANFDLPDFVSIICASPSIFLIENVIVTDCEDGDSAYVIVAVNLIPFLKKIDENNKRAEAVQQKLKEKKSDKPVVAKLPEPSKSQVKPATNFPCSTKESSVTSSVKDSISSITNRTTVTKPMVRVFQPLVTENTKPVMTSKISTIPDSNTSTPGTLLKKTTTSTPLMRTNITSTKPFTTSLPISIPQSSSFIITNPSAPKLVVNNSQHLGGTSIVNSSMKTPPVILKKALTNNLNTIIQTNAIHQKPEIQFNSPGVTSIGAQTSQGLVNLKLSTIGGYGGGGAIQVAVPVQQLNLKPTLVPSVDISGNKILKRVAGPAQCATVVDTPGLFQTITVPNNLSMRNVNAGSIISTQCSDGRPLQLVSSDSIQYLKEISSNHFMVQTQMSDPSTSKEATIITNEGGYHKLVLKPGSMISSQCAMQFPNITPAISSQYMNQFMSKPLTTVAAQCFQNLPLKTNSTVAGHKVHCKKVFTQPSQPPVFDVDDSSHESVAPPFHSYVSELPAKKRKNEDYENCSPKLKKIVDPVAYVKNQRYEINVLEKSILGKEREIFTVKKKLQTLKKRYLAVKNPCDTKSDEQLVEEILNHYFEQDAVQFFVSQMKVSGKTYSQYRWSEEDKLFALSLLYKNPLEYHILFEKFTLPSDKTLSIFVSKIKKAEQGVKK